MYAKPHLARLFPAIVVLLVSAASPPCYAQEACRNCTYTGEWSGGLRGFESSGALFGIRLVDLTNFNMPGVS